MFLKARNRPPRQTSPSHPRSEPDEPTQRLIVRGTVSYPDTSPAAGLTVIAFDKDIEGEDRLGEATTDAAGAYQITYSAAQFRRSKNEGRGADVFLRVYSAKHELLFQSDTVGNAPADLRVDVKLPAGQFVVRGRVTGASKGQLVRAYDKDLRSEEPLGEAFTDAEGNYEIRYSPEKFKRAEKGAADLRIAVCHPEGRELLSSDIFFNADLDQTVNLEITEGVPPPPSEYERYLTDLEPVLLGLALADLDDKDIDFLAGDTGIARAHIGWLVQAAKLVHKTLSPAETTRRSETQARVRASEASSIPAEVFYGWFRQGLPTELAALWLRSTADLIAELTKSIEANLVPRDISSHLDALEETLNQLRAVRTLQPAAEGKPPSLGDVLNTLLNP